MLWPDGRHLDQLTVDEFDARALVENTRLEQMMIFGNREGSAFTFDCHIIHANVPCLYEPVVAVWLSIFTTSSNHFPDEDDP